MVQWEDDLFFGAEKHATCSCAVEREEPARIASEPMVRCDLDYKKELESLNLLAGKFARGFEN